MKDTKCGLNFSIKEEKIPLLLLVLSSLFINEILKQQRVKISFINTIKFKDRHNNHNK